MPLSQERKGKKEKRAQQLKVALLPSSLLLAPRQRLCSFHCPLQHQTWEGAGVCGKNPCS